jgi:DNA primase
MNMWGLTPEFLGLLEKGFGEFFERLERGEGDPLKAEYLLPIYIGELLEKKEISVKVLETKDTWFGVTYQEDKPVVVEAFRKLIEQSDNHIEYRLAQIKAKYNVEDDAQKVEFLKECAGMVASLRSPLERDIYGARAAEAVGVSAEAMAQEVKDELRRRARAEKKRQERKDLNPAGQMQPAARELRYENIRSARAEEGIIRLLLLDEGLFPQTETLTKEKFSSPFLGQVYALLCQRHKEGKALAPELLAGQLTAEQIDVLAQILREPEDLSGSTQAMADYIRIIDTEQAKQREDIDPLLAAREKYLEKKSYGG